MKKRLVTDCLVSIFCVCFFLLANKYLVYIDWNIFELAYVKFFVLAVFPPIMGFVISLPFDNSDSDKVAINWQKLIIQGIPGFLLGIPSQSIIFLYMRLVKIETLDLGILNYPAMVQSQNPMLNAVFGVWFGKVLADSIKIPKKIGKSEQLTM